MSGGMVTSGCCVAWLMCGGMVPGGWVAWWLGGMELVRTQHARPLKGSADNEFLNVEVDFGP